MIGIVLDLLVGVCFARAAFDRLRLMGATRPRLLGAWVLALGLGALLPRLVRHGYYLVVRPVSERTLALHIVTAFALGILAGAIAYVMVFRKPRRELLTRVGVTAAVLGAIVAALALSEYEWDFGAPMRYQELYLEGLGLTLGATALAYLTGLVLGVGVALARMSRALWIRQIGDLYVEIIRGTPFLVQVMIAYFGIAPLLGLENKFMVGTLALGVFAAAYMGEILRAGIESVERGQFEASRSLGLSRGLTMRYVIFPQAFRRMIPPLTGELIALTKESSLLFAIGVMEMMSAARQVGADTYRNFEALLVVAGMYLSITIPLSLVARRLERRLGKSDRLGVDLQ